MKFVGPDRDELDIDDRPLLRFTVEEPPEKFSAHARMADITESLKVDRAAFAWCGEQFGEAGLRKMGCRWTHMAGVFWFREETDAFAFKMRWC